MATYQFIVAVLVAVVLQDTASGLQVEQEFFTTERPIFQDGNSNRDFKPMVSVDRENPKVDVHVPLFFDMTNDKANNKLDLSVLGGLVTVNRDKPKQDSSRPLTVTVFGIPVYSGFGGRGTLQRMNDFFGGNRKVEPERAPESLIRPVRATSAPGPTPTPVVIEQAAPTVKAIVLSGKRSSDELMQTLASRLGLSMPENLIRPVRATSAPTPTSAPSSVAIRQAAPTVKAIVLTEKRTSDDIMQTLASTFGKLTNFVSRATPISNTNGPAVGVSHGFVTTTKFTSSDFQPRITTEKIKQ